MANNIDVSAYTEALERYIQIFRRGESNIGGIRAELHMIRNDSMLPIYREAIDSLVAHLTVAELALEALGHQATALWQVQKAKSENTSFTDWEIPTGEGRAADGDQGAG